MKRRDVALACAWWIVLSVWSSAMAAPASRPGTIQPLPGDLAPVTPAAINNPAWMNRHKNLAKLAAENKDAQLIFVGDSITDFWQKQPSFTDNYGKYGALDLGISGDRTQHLLWRLLNGEIDELHPKVAVVMIGTNNAGSDKPQSVAAGVQKIVDTLHEKLPGTKVLLLAIFPRGRKNDPLRASNQAVNELIAALNGDDTRFLDINKAFLDENGAIPKDVMADGLHPTAKGYDLWAAAMKDTLEEMVK